MKKYISILFLLPIVLLSCEYDGGHTEVTVENAFTVTVPNYMEVTERLSPGSPFQYQNRFRTIYAVGHVDDKRESADLESYTDKALNGFTELLEEVTVDIDTNFSSFKGLPAMRAEIWGTVDEQRVFYHLMTVDGSKGYYQLCGWTLERRYEAYGDTVRTLVGSLKPL